MALRKLLMVLVLVGLATAASLQVQEPAYAGVEPFLAEITMFGGNFAPRGWAYCDGQLLPIQQNAALFSLLGTTYGGDGRTTFALPDLRGRVPIHAGQGPGLSRYNLGSRGGVETVTLSEAQMPAHTHAAATNTSADATLWSCALPEAPGVMTKNPSGAVLGRGRQKVYSSQPPTAAMHSSAISVAVNASTIIGQTGGSQPHYNMPPYLAVHFIIALQGVYPSRH